MMNECIVCKNNRITVSVQRRIMLEMLSFVDSICRNNNIKYSLIGGSLIGTIRHGGYIPWDDDIDIILTKTNYNKLKKILDSGSGEYQTLKYGNGGERFAFTKLVDVRTVAREYIQQKDDPNYGIYIDIFCYYPTANEEHERLKHFNRIKTLMKFITRARADRSDRTFTQNTKQRTKNIISSIMGYRLINILFSHVLNRYEESDYLLSNWPVYGFEKEIQLKKNTEEYIDAKFENLTVMIFKNYDEILKTTFGDYMQLPPESERAPKHSITAWWRDGYEDEAKKLKEEMRAEKKDA